MAQPAFGSSPSPMTPWANPGERNVLFTDGSYGVGPFNASVSFDAAALPVAAGAGDWLRSIILNVTRWRRLVLEVAYDAPAGTVSGNAEIIVLRSSALVMTADGRDQGPPAAGDDVWFPPSVTDGGVTGGALAAGVLPTGTDFNKDTTWGKQIHRPLVIQTAIATAASAKDRQGLDVDVSGARWAMVLARELGDPAHPGTLKLAYVGTT